MNNQLLGCTILVKTSAGQEYTGELYCYDTNMSNCFVLRENVNNGLCNYRILKTNAIKSVTALAPAPQRSPSPRPPLNRAVIERRERVALQKAAQLRHTYGVGVTEEAQELFDYLHKTHPDCKWDGTSIVVLGVRIRSPYRDQDCEAVDMRANEQTVNRLRTVMALASEKIKNSLKTKRAMISIPHQASSHSNSSSNPPTPLPPADDKNKNNRPPLVNASAVRGDRDEKNALNMSQSPPSGTRGVVSPPGPEGGVKEEGGEGVEGGKKKKGGSRGQSTDRKKEDKDRSGAVLTNVEGDVKKDD